MFFFREKSEPENKKVKLHMYESLKYILRRMWHI